MSVGDGIGIGIGRALQDFGRAMYEDHVWKERRKMLAEEARAELEAQRKAKREDLKYEASLKPPSESEVEEVGADGKRVKVRRQWEPDYEKGGGQFRELSRMPVMAKPEGRPFEVVRGGNRATVQRFDDGTEKVLGEGPRWNPNGGAEARKSPAWRQVQVEDGSYVWQDLNSAPSDKPLKAPPPYREREGRKPKDEDDLLAPKPKADKGEQPPVPGARKAPDGNWYVEKDGKFYMVEP